MTNTCFYALYPALNKAVFYKTNPRPVNWNPGMTCPEVVEVTYENARAIAAQLRHENTLVQNFGYPEIRKYNRPTENTLVRLKSYRLLCLTLKNYRRQ